MNRCKAKGSKNAGRRYFWELAEVGNDLDSTLGVVGTLAQADRYCETNRCRVVARYRFAAVDLDNPFIRAL